MPSRFVPGLSAVILVLSGAAVAVGIYRTQVARNSGRSVQLAGMLTVVETARIPGDAKRPGAVVALVRNDGEVVIARYLVAVVLRDQREQIVDAKEDWIFSPIAPGEMSIARVPLTTLAQSSRVELLIRHAMDDERR